MKNKCKIFYNLFIYLLNHAQPDGVACYLLRIAIYSMHGHRKDVHMNIGHQISLAGMHH